MSRFIPTTTLCAFEIGRTLRAQQKVTDMIFDTPYEMAEAAEKWAEEFNNTWEDGFNTYEDFINLIDIFTSKKLVLALEPLKTSDENFALRSIDNMFKGILTEEEIDYIKILFVGYGEGASFVKPVVKDWDDIAKRFMLAVELFAQTVKLYKQQEE